MPSLEKSASISAFKSNGAQLDLSACRSVEDNPYGEVLCEIFEVMLGSGSDKHNIARLEGVSLAIVK
jgi:hypothetical protein